MNIPQIRTRPMGEQFEEMGNNLRRNMPKVVIGNNRPPTRPLAQDVTKEDKIKNRLLMIAVILVLVYAGYSLLLKFI